MMSRCSKKKTTERDSILGFLRGAAPWDDEHGTAFRFGQTEHPPALSIGTSPEHRCPETHRLEKLPAPGTQNYNARSLSALPKGGKYRATHNRLPDDRNASLGAEGRALGSGTPFLPRTNT